MSALFTEGFDAGYQRALDTADTRSARMAPPEYFWSYEFRFDLRDAMRGEQEAVRVVLLAQRLDLDAFTERHVEVVELVLGRKSEARQNVERGWIVYD
jgi:hypothetical protein